MRIYSFSTLYDGRLGTDFDSLTNLVFHRVEKVGGRHRVFFTGSQLDFAQGQTGTAHRPFNNTYYQVTMKNIATSDPALEDLHVDTNRNEMSTLAHPLLTRLLSDELHLRHQAREEYLSKYHSKFAGDPMYNGIIIWQIQRSLKFRDEIIATREMRLGPQSGSDGLVELSAAEKMDRRILDMKFAHQIWETRKGFKTPIEAIASGSDLPRM
ncbi:hypothetical protein GGS26DRAFT_593245 [Hypomontagnella submonticulosa]|nr:hypothetical protein GGS26DRAFT_593245 [Hypomontagnella submonticulosa]